MRQEQDSEAGATDAVDISIEGSTETIIQSLESIWDAFLGHLPLLIAGFMVLLATGLFAALARRIVRRIVRRMIVGVRLRQSLKELVERFVVIGIWILGTLLAAMVVFPGLNPADGLAALGIGSVAIGLAFKDIFENLFAGVLILWRFPFENGDYIECDGVLGQVEDVTIRNTLLRTTEGELIVIPNATIYKSKVGVLTHADLRRLTVICGVAYGEDIGESRSVIEKAVASCETVADRKPIEIFAQEFASSSINFEVTWWTGPTPLEQRKSRDEVVEAVKSALDEAGIEIPFPYRTLTFKEPLKTLRGDD